ncbi:aa3-type cytochrome c oxidase subunit IV [Sphingomonas sp. CJ99]
MAGTGNSGSVDRRTYDGFMRMTKIGSVIVAIAVAFVLWLIAG